MSNDWYHDMVSFHREVMKDDIPFRPGIPSLAHQELRKRLIEEETDETLLALVDNDLVKLADGIVDSIVVLLGTAVIYGMDIRPVWDEVCRTNTAKMGGPRRVDGKILKPKGWVPPDIAGILRKQGYR